MVSSYQYNQTRTRFQFGEQQPICNKTIYVHLLQQVHSRWSYKLHLNRSLCHQMLIKYYCLLSYLKKYLNLVYVSMEHTSTISVSNRVNHVTLYNVRLAMERAHNANHVMLEHFIRQKHVLNAHLRLLVVNHVIKMAHYAPYVIKIKNLYNNQKMDYNVCVLHNIINLNRTHVNHVIRYLIV